MSETIEARVAALESELGELRDREIIREMIHRYCQAVDRCDLDMLKSCYWEDGYDDHGFFGGNAHAFAEYVIPVLEQVDSSMHSITNTRFKFDGDRCACSSQWSVVHRLAHEDGYTDFWHQGRYLDVWEKRQSEWKILHRIIAGDFDRWLHAPDIRTVMEASPNATLRGCRGSADPGNLWFDVLEHRPERPAMRDFWGMFYQLSALDRKST